MSVAKIIAATTFTSLSGVFFYNAIQGLRTEMGNSPRDSFTNRPPSDPQDAIQPQKIAPSDRKSAISKPEKLTPRKTPKKPTVTVAQPERSPLPMVSTNAFPAQLNRNAAPPEIISSREIIRRLQQKPSAAPRRNDITGHWAESYIEALTSRSVVQGFPDGSFRPDQAVTETEFLTIELLGNSLQFS